MKFTVPTLVLLLGLSLFLIGASSAEAFEARKPLNTLNDARRAKVTVGHFLEKHRIEASRGIGACHPKTGRELSSSYKGAYVFCVVVTPHDQLGYRRLMGRLPGGQAMFEDVWVNIRPPRIIVPQ